MDKSEMDSEDAMYSQELRESSYKIQRLDKTLHEDRATSKQYIKHTDPFKFVNIIVRHPILFGATILTILYIVYYFGQPPLPGNNPAAPLGWWGWYDQSQYLRSARALNRIDLAPVEHWYPFGYSLLGAMFVDWSPAHAWVLVNWVCLLGAFAGFVAFARRVGVSPAWSALIFIATVGLSRSAIVQWVTPWSTTPVAALTWLLLATAAGYRDGIRRPVLVGAIACAIPLFRPTDALVAGLCVVFVLGQDRSWRALIRIAAGAAALALPYAALHLHVYGFALSPYMVGSSEVGFTLQRFGWKAYTILLDPSPWFLDGQGLFRVAPYLALAIPGLIVALARGGAAALLAGAVIVHIVLYISYMDLLPTGLWRYMNVHYFKWILPAGGLLSFLFIRELLCWRTGKLFPLAPAVMAVSVLILCLRLEPVPVGLNDPASMLVYHGSVPGFDAAYFGPLEMRDTVGVLRQTSDVRAIPIPGGMRVYAMRRDFKGTPEFTILPLKWAVSGPPERFAARLSIGPPCWLPVIHCTKMSNDQLPPSPLP